MSKGLVNVVKKKLKNSLYEHEKNVSWSHECDSSSNSKSKKTFRSTPYPNVKKITTSNNDSVCKSLSFDDSDLENPKENEWTSENVVNGSLSLDSKPRGIKRKRPYGNWEVTSCDVIKPDKTNRQCLNENYSAESKNSVETLVSDKNDPNFEVESSSSDSEGEEIFKLTLPDTNKCHILDIPDKINNKQNNVTENLKNTIETNDILHECSNEVSENNETVKRLRFGKLVRCFMGEDFCILFLKHPLKLYINGKLSITVLFGSIEILGSVLNNKKQSVDVYSPRGQSFLCIETNEYGLDSKEFLQQTLKYYNIPTKQLKEFLYSLGKNDSVILVRNINNNLTNYMSLHVAQYLYPKPIHCEKKIENKLHCLFEVEDKSWKVLNKNELEKCCNTVKEIAANSSRRPSTVMLCGGKSVGKSTLFRYMTNYFLNEIDKVVCIDLDPGQSEFTIAGCISVLIIEKPLLGPNFSHLQTPVKSYFVGDVNIINCIDRYITSVKELIQFCEKNFTSYPRIVNYMGFSKSLGCDLTVAVIKMIRPSEVVQIHSSAKSRNYSLLLTKENVENYVYSFPIITPQTKLDYNLLTFRSVAEEKVEGDFQFEARLSREMSIISYFSQMIDDGKEITSIPPYSVKLSSIKLHDLNYSKENILAVMNGNLVALCNIKNNTINRTTVFECFGFGITRGIDKHSQELYLLTPVKEEILDNVNCLIRGNINLPPSLYMTKGRQGLVPYILLGNQQGTSKVPKRSYMNLKQLLKKK